MAAVRLEDETGSPIFASDALVDAEGKVPEEESAEPEDVNDNAGSGYTSPTEDSAIANPGPSATTY